MGNVGKIRIHCEVYQKFYDELFDCYCKKLDAATIAQWGIKNYNLWDAKDTKTGTEYFEQIFGDRPKSRYWYNRVSQYERERKKEGYCEENPFIINKALKLMECNIPEQFTKSLDALTEARVRYQVFLEKYFPEFFKLHNDKLKIYDVDSNSIIKGVKQTEREDIIVKKYPDNIKTSDIQQTVTLSPQAIVVQEVTLLIQKYFELLNAKNYAEAYELFSLSYKQSAFAGSLSNFADLFTNSIEFLRFSYFDYKCNDTSDYATMRILFWEKKKKYLPPEFDTENYYSLLNIKELERVLRKLQRKMEKSGISEGIMSMHLKDVFSEDFADAIWKESLMERKIIQNVLVRDKYDFSLTRLCEVTFIKNNESWRISDVESINASKFITDNSRHNLPYFQPEFPFRDFLMATIRLILFKHPWILVVIILVLIYLFHLIIPFPFNPLIKF